MSKSCSRRLQTTLAIALAISLAITALALAGQPKLKVTGPTKGASYVGTLHEMSITVKVSPNGKKATVTLPGAPAYCQGGSGPVRAATKPAAISKKRHTFTARVSFSSAVGSSKKPFAMVTIKGTFFGSVLQGVSKSTFPKSKECNGQESFEALA